MVLARGLVFGGGVGVGPDGLSEVLEAGIHARHDVWVGGGQVVVLGPVARGAVADVIQTWSVYVYGCVLIRVY